jgi:transmembrane sensor
MNYETIASYLAGELQGAEKQEVESWIKENEKNYHDFSKWQLIWKASQTIDYRHKPDVETAWSKIKPSVVPFTENEVEKSQKEMWNWIGKVAAILVLVAGLIFIVLDRISHFASSKVVWQQSETNASQRSEIVLADGSKVWLNNNSILRYPKQFTSINREVFLEGEAFFEITPREHQSFIVHSGNSITQVLGTSFNLRSYEIDSVVSLNVLTGKVSFKVAGQKQQTEVVLKTHQTAHLNKKTNIISSYANVDENFLAWKTGKMSFRNTAIKRSASGDRILLWSKIQSQ